MKSTNEPSEAEAEAAGASAGTCSEAETADSEEECCEPQRFKFLYHDIDWRRHSHPDYHLVKTTSRHYYSIAQDWLLIVVTIWG